MEVVVGLDAGGDCGFCVKEKLRGFDAAAVGACAGFGGGGLVVVPAKKLPPLNGGGEDICGAVGGDLADTFVGNPRPEKEEDDFAGDAAVGKLKEDPGDWTGGGDFAAALLVVEKLIPPKTSARPPNASGFGGGGDVIPPNDG